MDPVAGYEMASWSRLRRLRDEAGSRDLAAHSVARGDGARALRCALARRLAGGGVASASAPAAGGARGGGWFTAMFGSELEFFLFKESYEEVRGQLRDPTPSVPYILDYHVLATSYDEPFLRAVRNGMAGAGIPVRARREAGPGQQEINFRYADAVTMADNHVVYKNGIKEIAQQHGVSVTFMAKPDHTWVGSSCHVHGSLWRGRSRPRLPASPTSSSSSSPVGSRARGSWRSSRSDYPTRTSATPPSRGRRRHSPGVTTTARVASASSATAPGCVWRRGFRAPTSVHTSRSPRCWRPACGGSNRASRRRRPSKETPTSRTSSASRPR